MLGRHYRYLTNSYVEEMGMEKFVVDRGPVVVGFVSENGVMPVPYRAFDLCVAYNHGLYVREPDGLAWSIR